MNKKISAMVGCLLLVATGVPLATAHLSSPSMTSFLLTGDECRLQDDAPCTTHGGVSGTYYGAASTWLVSPTLFSSSDPVILSYMLCDLEVVGDGTGPSTLDEEWVDDEYNPFGIQPDGTWDDGGFGGACHTQDHYDYGEYNTWGCNGKAYAKDAVSGGDVWIGAACDWKTTGGGQGLAMCLVNEILSDATVPGMAACVSVLIAGGISGATFVACGGEGVSDDVHYGHGGGGVAFPNYTNDENDPTAIYAYCNTSDEAAAVFVHSYVTELGPAVIPATGGWIDQPGSASLPDCADSVDNDGDGHIDREDSGCHIKIAGISYYYDPTKDNE